VFLSVFEIDKECLPAFDCFLFHTEALVRSMPGDEIHIFDLVENSSVGEIPRSFARFPLAIEGKAGKSPSRAPFGSFQFDSRVSDEELIYFVNEVETY
jgi:hypothetical protein